LSDIIGSSISNFIFIGAFNSRSESKLNDLVLKLVDFIEQRELLYFRVITVLMIIVLFLAAERFQDLVLFVSVGLLIGGVYYRRKGALIDIGTLIGACLGFIVYLVFFVLRAIIGFL
jgi:hypothetical protein